MRILTYRELESKDNLLPLFDQAFNWTFDQNQFDDFVKIDPRLKNSPVGFCAVENSRIGGYVGVMDLATRTLKGQVEHVGGLYGVATLPSYTRRGIFTQLMNKAHEYFKEKNYSFSFLGTTPVFIAHALYEKLGYADMMEYPSAYKVIRKKKPLPAVTEVARTFDVHNILRIYNEFAKIRTGFVVRDAEYMEMLKKVEGIKARQSIVGENGYVIFREDKSGIWIRELVALNAEEIGKLVSIIEGMAKAIVYDRAILNRTLLDVYRSRGYMIQERGFAVLMFKPLTADASFKQTYGDRFFLSRLDAF